MSFVRKAVVWLGLNEEYPTDDFATQPGEQQARREARAADLSGRQPGPQGGGPQAMGSHGAPHLDGAHAQGPTRALSLIHI